MPTKLILKFIRPDPYSVFNIHDVQGIKLLTRLRLGLSHLKDHKFRHNFQDCVCVCVCVFIFFHCEGFFRLQDVQDILERYGSTTLCCEYSSGCLCQVPSSLFPNLSYFTSKDVTPARRKLERIRYDILCSCEKIIYIDIGYKFGPSLYQQLSKRY